MASTFPTPPSPGLGVGTRRKGPKNLPRLPLSAFSPPNSGTSEQFPLPPSPSTVHPEGVIDASVYFTDGDLALSRWKEEAGSILGDRIGGVVVALRDADTRKLDQLSTSTPVLRVLVPFSLDAEEHVAPPKSAALITSFTGITSHSVASLRWALQQGCPVDIEINTSFNDETLFESFEDLMSKALTDLESVPPIIISNLLPPPDDLSLPIVKLISHRTYRGFQSRTAALSLIPNVYIKLVPPIWESQVPETPSALTPGPSTDSKEKKEWKRRIKMYLGPVMEAFGYERIIFGSSAAGSVKSLCGAGDWYAIARESLAELAVEQSAIDAVFCETAKRVYGP